MVLAVAGVGVYVLVFSGPVRSGGTPPTVALSTASGGRTSTLTVATSAPSGATTDSSSAQAYSGTFTFVVPIGPSGISDGGLAPVEWNSTQTASGTFEFSIDPADYTGTGSGRGSITVATQGYCEGSATVPYTFSVRAFHIPGENLTIAFETPTPSTATVKLSCQGPTTGFNEANNPVTFLSVYPNLVSTASAPATFSQTVGGTSYTVTVR